jgi:hypothetical protein
MRQKYCRRCFAAAVCVCLGASAVLTLTEVAENYHAGVTLLKCVEASDLPDLAPPDCGGGPSPHNRTTYSNAITVTGSTSSTLNLYTPVGISAYDAEDAAEHIDQWFPFVSFNPPSSLIPASFAPALWPTSPVFYVHGGVLSRLR